jgi:hypothetical protein
MRRLALLIAPVLLLFLSGCGDQTLGPDPDLTPSFAKGGKPGKPGDDGGDGGEDPSGSLVFTSIETSYLTPAGASSCAIEDADGDGVGPAYCWGYNGTYALGLGGKKKGGKTEPSDPVGGGSLLFSDVQLGQGFACGIEDGDADGKGPLYCWGRNDRGELADGTTDTRSDPAPVESDQEFFAVDLGTFGGCALAGNPGGPGDLYCWGSWFGEGGTNAPVPTRVADNLQFKSITTNFSTVCGIDADGGAWCWGNNGEGQVGNGTVSDMVWEPQLVSGGHEFQALAVGGNVTCGLTGAGDPDGVGNLLCWGTRWVPGGEIVWQSLVPAPMDPGDNAGDPLVDLVRGFCATGASGQVYCWGENGYGQVGDGSYGTYGSWVEQPRAVASPGTFLSMGEKNGHTCGIGTDGFAYCWGANGSGELGNGTTQDSAVPVKVSGQ